MTTVAAIGFLGAGAAAASEPTYPTTEVPTTTTSVVVDTTTSSTEATTTTEAPTTTTEVHKVFVCKYVGTPGVDERLQTGQNPIDVDVHSLLGPPVIGQFFADAQGRSVVIAFDTGQAEPSPDACPLVVNTTTTTEAPTTTTTECPSDRWNTTTTTGPCVPDTTTTTEAPTTTTTCADCVINTVVITPPPTTGPPRSSTTTTSTTEAPPPSATTVAPPPVVKGLDIGSAASVCSRDVPLVNITFGNQPEFNGQVGTIEFVSLDGTLHETHQVTYQAGETITLLYPGATIDPVTGVATDWPGWKLNADGFWVLDPTDAAYRDGIRVIATLPGVSTAALGRSRALGQVSAETTISYPPETATCASPTGPFPPATTAPPSSGGLLPVTGDEALRLVLGAIAVIGGGGGLLYLGRRRWV